MNERQLQNMISTAFRLQTTADKAVASIDEVLAQVMNAVRTLVASLPEESLLRGRAWRNLEPLVRLELQVYEEQLGRTIQQTLEAAEPGIEAAAIEQAPLPKEERSALKDVAVTAAALALIPRVKVNGKSLARLFSADQPGQASPVAKSLFRAVDKAVRKGIIDDKTTDEIAKSIAERAKRSGLDGINLTAPSVARQLRGQATALSRTAIGTYNQEVKERLYGQAKTKTQLRDKVWEHVALLDSVTCSSCMFLDGQTWDQGDPSRPQLKIHIGCRCDQVLVDPETLVGRDSREGLMIRSGDQGPYKGRGRIVEVDGKTFWGKPIVVRSDDGEPVTYADLLARWAKTSHTSLRQALGVQRSRIFIREMSRPNADPQRILLWMLRGEAGAKRFIPLKQLAAKEVLSF